MITFVSKPMLLGLSCALLAACVHLGKRDAFPAAGKAQDLSSLQASLGTRDRVSFLKVSANGRPVTACYVRHPNARGVLLFFGGSGNQLEAAVQGLGPRAAARGLDLAAFSYYQAGEPVPSVTQVRAITRAVYAAIRAMPSSASRSVYLLGHSAGGWFALDLAAAEKVNALVLVGAETTPAEVIRRTYAPWAYLVAIAPDADARQLDASRYAPRVQVPTLIVTSRRDEAVPTAVARELFALLPATTPKELVVLAEPSHGRYFLNDEFWRQFDAFLRLP